MPVEASPGAGAPRPDPGDAPPTPGAGCTLHPGPPRRAVPLIDKQRSAEIVHKSVFDRQDRPPITIGDYRPSRRLKTGQPARQQVYPGPTRKPTGPQLADGRDPSPAPGG